MRASTINPVSIPCIGYQMMSDEWDLIHDLLGGTKSMRAVGEKWLPRENKESLSAYDGRLKRSILFNGYSDTVSKLCNKPLSRSVIINNLPDELSYLFNDIDGTGKSLNDFVREVLENLINFGIAHIFVDHTKIPEINLGGELTKQDELQLGARVYFNNISPLNLIGWRADESVSSKVLRLSQIRIKKTIFEPDGQFGDKEVEYIIVYNPFSYEIYKKTPTEKGDTYMIVDSGIISLGKIPLITIYANKEGFMMAKPPLIDLAWLNLGHWQSSSDHKNILRFSRFGLLFGKGLPKKMIDEGTIEIGPSKAILTESETADLRYVEHGGAALQIGRQDLQDITLQMEAVGQQPLIKNLPDTTATGQRIDASRNISMLQSWVRNTEIQLKNAIILACEWRAITPPEDLSIDIYDDFDSEFSLDSADKSLLLQLRESSVITKQTLLHCMKKRNVLPYDLNVDEELAAVEEESTEELMKYVAQQEAAENMNMMKQEE